MKTTYSSLAFFAAIARAQLDIPALLAEAALGPAPDSDPRWTDWTAPGEGDVRSPCPGLNSLANHGFLNHNGKNLTIPDLILGGAQGLGMGPDFMTVIGAVGLQSSPNPLGGSFDLDQLDQHNFPIEHDGSLSRMDAYFGNDYSFNQTIFDEFLSNFGALTTTTTDTASVARYSRINNSLTTDPDVTYGPMQFILSSGETGLYVQSMSSPVENAAPLEYVKYLFEREELPFAIGWRATTTPVTLFSLGQYVLELYAANPDKVAEGLQLVAGSYGDFLADMAGGMEVLSNLTSGISDELNLGSLRK